MLLLARFLSRRADAGEIIEHALEAKAGGCGYRAIARMPGLTAAAVRRLRALGRGAGSCCSGLGPNVRLIDLPFLASSTAVRRHEHPAPGLDRGGQVIARGFQPAGGDGYRVKMTRLGIPRLECSP
jgi:hypothetical protein